jgi:hypothetical protein
MKIKTIKKREWLNKNEKMQDISPKKYYKEKFKEIVDEIQNNTSKKEVHYLDNV